jgi:NhaA family Na+:H+ antiporter
MPSSRRRSASRKTIAERVTRPLQRFLAIEAASTILLVLATAIALVWANSPAGEGYAQLWSTYLGVNLGPYAMKLSLGHWVNDGLMVIFFFLVGMEIKHELAHGELSTRERAMLPLFGALGGMVVPAGIYAAFHAGSPAAAGWGVPMATDIAFAVAALAVLGARVPSGLKVFLLALAIVDDLGAVSVIAIFYTQEISVPALAAAGAGLALVVVLQRAGFRSYGLYWILGIGVWFATHESGVHATIAGVVLGLLTPTKPATTEESLGGRTREAFKALLERIGDGGPAGDRKHAAAELEQLSRASLSPLEFLSHKLHPWSAFVIMPIFALANAGVRLEPETLGDPLGQRIAAAVALGLFVGKPVGITLVAWLAVRLRLAALPNGVGWGAIFGAGMLGGIGFTMALFITALAFADPAHAAASKVGVFVASLLATVAGVAILGRVLPRVRPG